MAAAFLGLAAAAAAAEKPRRWRRRRRWPRWAPARHSTCISRTARAAHGTTEPGSAVSRRSMGSGEAAEEARVRGEAAPEDRRRREEVAHRHAPVGWVGWGGRPRRKDEPQPLRQRRSDRGRHTHTASSTSRDVAAWPLPLPEPRKNTCVGCTSPPAEALHSRSGSGGAERRPGAPRGEKVAESGLCSGKREVAGEAGERRTPRSSAMVVVCSPPRAARGSRSSEALVANWSISSLSSVQGRAGHELTSQREVKVSVPKSKPCRSFE